MRRFLIVFSSACLYLAPSVCLGQSRPAATPRLNSAEYAQVQQSLSRGWNTWDVHSVTTHVLLPEGLSVRVGIQKKTRIVGDGFLPTALIGRLEPDAEQVFPGPHAFDGSYTDLRLTWQGLSLRIQSATDAGDLVLLVSPLPERGDAGKGLPATVVFSVGFLWNRPGTVDRTADHVEAHAGSRMIPFFVEGQEGTALDTPVAGPYLAVDLTGPRAFSSGKRRTMAEVEAILKRQRAAYEQSNAKAGQSASIADAIQTVLAWDTIYDPENRRVISPVSRVWSVGWGGYVLFDWDTFFAATMASIAIATWRMRMR
jgi:putative isomerase